jgi:4-amino-4-deoxy-L-arabinose transferase-like glycosyltransferase
MPSAQAQLVKKDPWIWLVLAWGTLYAITSLWLARHGTALPPDSMDYAEAARSLVRGQGLTINRVFYNTGFFPSIRHVLELHALLQPLLLAPLFALGGPLPTLVRVPSVLFTACLGVLVFWAGRRFFGTLAAVIATAIVYTHTDLVFIAMGGSDDAGFALFALAALTCFLIGVESAKRPWFIAAGLCAALTTLEKYSGMVLPAVFSAVLVVHAPSRRAAGLKTWLWLVAPVLPVAVLYAVRNYFASGTFGSSYGGLEWLGKGDMSAYFAYYPAPPNTSEVWAQLGSRRILELIRGQFLGLALAIRSDSLLLAGPLVLLWLTRRHRAFALTALAYVLVLVLLVCVVHHVELRYLSGLIPVYAIAVGAAVAPLASWIATRAASQRPLASRLGAVLFLAALAWATRKAFVQAEFVSRLLETKTCTDTARYVRASLAANAPILTSNSWFVAWELERPGVNAPTNGDDAIMTVVRHYGIRWALTGAEVYGALHLDEALSKPELQAKLRPERVFDGATCDVYKLAWRE